MTKMSAAIFLCTYLSCRPYTMPCLVWTHALTAAAMPTHSTLTASHMSSTRWKLDLVKENAHTKCFPRLETNVTSFMCNHFLHLISRLECGILQSSVKFPAVCPRCSPFTSLHPRSQKTRSAFQCISLSTMGRNHGEMLPYWMTIVQMLWMYSQYKRWDFPHNSMLFWLLIQHKCLHYQVYNVNTLYGPDALFPVDININMAKVMGVFLAQLP